MPCVVSKALLACPATLCLEHAQRLPLRDRRPLLSMLLCGEVRGERGAISATRASPSGADPGSFGGSALQACSLSVKAWCGSPHPF